MACLGGFRRLRGLLHFHGIGVLDIGRQDRPGDTQSRTLTGVRTEAHSQTNMNNSNFIGSIMTHDSV